MEEIENEILETVNKLNEKRLTRKEQIEVLKEYKKIIELQNEKLENNFILGIFVSSFGLGLMVNSPNEINTTIACLMVISGFVISLNNENAKKKTRKNKDK